MRVAERVGICMLVSAMASGFTSPRPSDRSSLTRVFGKPEIQVVSQVDNEFLASKGVSNWPTWGCDVGSFPWSYGETESCYVLAGKVTVTPTDGREAVTFVKGDFVTFPAGMSCKWDVHEAVNKHYMFF
jgi:uncharacterized cupin superfamily protein